MRKIALSPADYRLAFVVLGVVALVPLAVRSEYWLGVVITGLYFAMLAQNWNLLAGITGLFSMAPAAFAMVGAYTTGLLLRSRVGLFLLAIRDDEVGAVARGVDVVRYKTLAFTISSAGCGIAGALFVHFLQLASPELGLILQTGLVISMVVIGGMGTVTGPLVGALLMEVAAEALREVGVRHLLVFSAMVILVGRFF